MKLSELQTGEKGVIVKVMGRGAFRKRIIEMGFIRGKEVEVIQRAPLRDPIHYRVMSYDVSLRRNDAALIEIVSIKEHETMKARATKTTDRPNAIDAAQLTQPVDHNYLSCLTQHKAKTINVALVGNPNCGKTTLFNYASGSHEHVGNYSGVTVDAKEAVFHQDGYTFNLVDLPGTYSLSAYTPEELYVRRHLTQALPDVVINVVDASNIERNLYLTTQLIDMDARMVIALNMYDELTKQGEPFDYEELAKMIGVPIVPTISNRGEGIKELFARIIEVYEERDPILRHIHINYGETLEAAISSFYPTLESAGIVEEHISKRHLAIKLLENDSETETIVSSYPSSEMIFSHRDRQTKEIEQLLNAESETAITDARYGFIAGALRETYERPPQNAKKHNFTERIDHLMMHKIWGIPIFFGLMWLLFWATFTVGQYPMDWIETGVGMLSEWVRNYMTDGELKDLLVDGIIGGVGGVIVFLPNIVILYALISLMEDSGYMSRAAFLMDKIMHRMGLHGKSFIPMVMGFGCSVPAIMATRTIESRQSRMITMLVTPLMSCSARLPVYVLLAGAFFPENAGSMLFLMYIIGVVIAVVMARLFKKVLFSKEDVPFVMELPPYRRPTTRSVLVHMWEKAKQYLQKMGGVILVASILIWFLGYFPRPSEGMTEEQHQEQSYIGVIGKTIEPVMAPLGFNWKASIGLVTGLAAKEVVVSTIAVLYAVDAEDEAGLSERLSTATAPDGKRDFTPLIALSLMLFVLIYFPCIAVIAAVIQETGSWRWGVFVMVYTTVLAWIVSFLTYQGGVLIQSFIG